jgi:hypothetical protein
MPTILDTYGRTHGPSTYGYYLLLEGIPAVPSSVALPSGWITGGRTNPVTLDLSQGIAPPPCAMQRKTGIAQVGSLSLALTQTLTTPAFGTQLTTSIDWSDTTAPAAWVDDGDYFVGRETIGVASGTMTRGKYLSLAWRHEGDDVTMGAARYSMVAPTTYRGRHIRLIQFACNRAGQPYDTALFDPADAAATPHSREAWRGVIDSLQPDSLGGCTISCRGLETVIDGMFGQQQIQGRLLSQGGERKQFFDEASQQSQQIITKVRGYIVDGRNIVKIKLQQPYVLSAAIPRVTEIQIAVPTGFTEDVAHAIAVAMREALNDSTETPWQYADWEVNIHNLYSDPANIAAKYPGAYFIDITARITDPLFYANSESEAQTWTLTIDDQSPLPQIGFALGEWQSTTAVIDAIAGDYLWPDWQAPNLPPAVYVGSTDTSIHVWLDLESEANPEAGTAFPASGYAVVEDGDKQELIEYQSITKIHTDHYRLNDCRRGAMGTQPTEWVVAWDGASLVGITGAAGTKAIKRSAPVVRCVVGWDTVSIFEIMLRTAMTSGVSGLRSSTYDAGTADWISPALPEDVFAVAQWEAQAETFSPAVAMRQLVIGKPTKIKEWWGEELAALGLVLHAGPYGQLWQLQVTRIAEPSANPVGTLSESVSIADLDLPEYSSDLSDVVNVVTMRPSWDVAKEEPGEGSLTWISRDSQVITGISSEIELRPRGLITPSHGTLYQLVVPLLMRYQHETVRIDLAAASDAWRYRIGDTIEATVRGETLPWTIIGVQARLVGSGSAAACTLQLMRAGWVSRLYAPAATVTGWTAGTGAVTLDANDFQRATNQEPVSGAFAASDGAWFGTTPPMGVEVWAADGECIAHSTITASPPGVTAALTLTSPTSGTLTFSGATPAKMGTGCILVCPERDGVTGDRDYAQTYATHLWGS